MTPCIEYAGTRNHKGYGVSMFQGRRHTAHRAAWLRSGRTIPVGFVLDHLCRNRACVNLDHLEPVTNRENLLRGDTLPARELAKDTCPAGHPLDGLRHDKRRLNPIRSCRTCERVRWHRRKPLDAEAAAAREAL